jgi:hypothetical protein
MTIADIKVFIDRFAKLEVKGALTINFSGDGKTATLQGNALNEETMKLFLSNKKE